MALSDAAVRQAKATGKDYTLGDIDGLSLAVTATGGRSWHFRYCWASKQKRMSLGTYPEVGLREARALRDEARARLAKGINPRIHRKHARDAVLQADQNTFKSMFDRWVAHRALTLKDGRQSTLSQIRRIFNKDVLPTLGKRSLFEIKRPDLLEVLARIEQRRAFTTAEKCRTWFNQLFRFALVKVSGLEQNPASDLDVVAAPKPPVAHHPFLRIAELPAFLCTLRGYGGMLQTQLGIRLLLLTGVRTGELRWATPDQFDLERALWVIPPEVVKQLQLEMRKEGKRSQDIPPYIVPLSVQALEVVRYLLQQMRPAQRHLLSHRSDLDKRISENTLNGALRRMGYADQLTGHGIRATLSTVLHEVGYPKVWVDAQLSHADPDKVSAAYNHAEYVELRRRMMQDWADRLDLLEQGRVEAASTHLTIRLEGAVLPAEGADFNPSASSRVLIAPSSPSAPVTEPGSLRLPAVPQVPQPPEPVEAAPPSAIQQQRQAMLDDFEAPHNLSVQAFARLVGKSRDQINRDIKARRLLAISLGNRGHRIPDWQLDPVRHSLIQAVLDEAAEADSWTVYRALSQPSTQFNGKVPIDIVSPRNLSKTRKTLCVALQDRRA